VKIQGFWNTGEILRIF